MSGGNNSARRKRVRLFGPDPLPNVVFSLDTNRQSLPLHLLSQQARNSPALDHDSGKADATPGEDVVVRVTSSGNASAQHPSRLALGVQLCSEAMAAWPARDDNQQGTGIAVEGSEGTPQRCNTFVTAVRHPSNPSPATPGTQPLLAFGRALSNGVKDTSSPYKSRLLQGGGDNLLSLKSPCPKTALEAAAPTAAVPQHGRAPAALHGRTARSSQEDNLETDAVKEETATATGVPAVAVAAVIAQKLGDFPPLHARITTTTSRAESADEPATAHRAGGSKDGMETAIPGTPLPDAAAENATLPRTDNAGRAHKVADAAGEKGCAGETAPSQPRQPGSAAASMVASFLKRGNPVPVPTPTPASPVAGSPTPTSKNPVSVSSSSFVARSTSAPATPTPTPLASLVTGVPPGSDGNAPSIVRGAGSDERRRWRCNPGAIGAGGLPNAKGGVGGEGAWVVSENGVRSPHRVAGGSRFFNDEWPPRLKERRRVVRFPKRNEPAGTRILYWVRGNYRVHDNLALSAAMWLSTKLRMPLQAVTFVDPAIGRSAPTRPLSAESARGADEVHGAEQRMPFRTAVEASALCEMEEALRVLNIPLVAVACATIEVPAALAHWCSHRRGRRGEKASNGSPAASPTSAAAAAAPASTGSSIEGGVHVAIADESYHPQQLLTMERVNEALRGVALYTVDSSCVCPVNTYRGGRATVARQVATAAAATEPSEFSSREDFRQAQAELLPTARTELMPRPRLPLEAQLQASVLADKERTFLPGEFEKGVRPATSSMVVVDWGALREVSTRRFPGFGKPIDRDVASSTKDLLAIFGGGERVGEAALRQTLGMATATPSDRPGAAKSVPGSRSDERAPERTYAQLESEVLGLGFGGSLLHLLRLGSVSCLYIVQQSTRDLVEAVLWREYALLRSFSFYQSKRRRRSAVTPTSTHGGSLAAQHVWRATDWNAFVPAWVWEELRRGQRDTRQHQHSPGEIRSAGSTLPSSVHDGLFSAIQARLATGGRLHPTLTPYWARAVVKMMLIPSQAISLIVDLVEELCIGASHAGDIVPDLLACAFDAFKDAPDLVTLKDIPDTLTFKDAPGSAQFKDTPGSGAFKDIPDWGTSKDISVLDTTRSRTGTAGLVAAGSATGGTDNASANTPRGDRAQVRKIPVFGRLTDTPLASVEGLQSAFGGVDALTRILLPELQPVSPTAGSGKHHTVRDNSAGERKRRAR